MCLSLEELLFIVSPPSYSSGAGLSHTLSLYLSHYLALCILPPPSTPSLSSSFYIFDSLPLSLPLSHPHSHSPRQENKGDLATYLVCFCLRACVMLRAQPTAPVSSTDTEITSFWPFMGHRERQSLDAHLLHSALVAFKLISTGCHTVDV